jgi:hypothetical protein
VRESEIQSEIYEVKFINLLSTEYNGENMRFWLAFFIRIVLAYFLSIWHEEHIIQQLKAW